MRFVAIAVLVGRVHNQHLPAPTAHVLLEIARHPHRIRPRHTRLARKRADQGAYRARCRTFRQAEDRRLTILALHSGLRKSALSAAPPSPLSSSAARRTCAPSQEHPRRRRHLTLRVRRASALRSSSVRARTRSVPRSRLRVSTMCSRPRRARACSCGMACPPDTAPATASTTGGGAVGKWYRKKRRARA